MKILYEETLEGNSGSVEALKEFQGKLQTMKTGVTKFKNYFPSQKFMDVLAFLMNTYVWTSICIVVVMFGILLGIRNLRKSLIKEEICLEQDSKKAKLMWKKINRLVNCQGCLSILFMTIALLFNLTGISSVYVASFTHGLCSNADKLTIDRNVRFAVAPYEVMKISDICLDSYEKNLELTLEQKRIQSSALDKSNRELFTTVMLFAKAMSIDLLNINVTSIDQNTNFMTSINKYTSLLADRVQGLNLNFEYSPGDGPDETLELIREEVKCLDFYTSVLLHSSQCRTNIQHCVAPDTHTPEEYSQRIGGDQSCAQTTLEPYSKLYSCIRDIDSLSNNMKTSFNEEIKEKIDAIQTSLQNSYISFLRLAQAFDFGKTVNVYELLNKYFGHGESNSMLRLHCNFLEPYSLAAIGKKFANFAISNIFR